jgi:SAM-dependent methyltransferase
MEHDPSLAADAIYDQAYYERYCGPLPYSREHQQWFDLFAGLAETLVDRLAPRRVLDVGCAKGFLLEVLRDRGVEAFGVDVSSFAVGEIRADLQPYARVLDAASLDPSERYDLVTCIEVLEHMPEPAALAALDAMCQVAPVVVFSSSPDDHDEPTHVNVQPIGYWVEAFAARGFSPRLDLDLSGFAGQAMAFERAAPPIADDAQVRALYAAWVERAVSLAHRTTDLARQTAAAEAAARERDAAQAELARIHASDGWRIACLLRRTKDGLLPEGSARQRVWSRSRSALLSGLGLEAASARPPSSPE